MALIDSISTAQQLFDATELGRCELVKGELEMMSPAGFEHGRIVMRIARPLDVYVTERGLGAVTGAETGFHIEQGLDTVRAPDIGFVHSDRIPSEPLKGFFPGAPDLAVEVLSPSDRPKQVQQKVEDWLGAGCQSVWVVNPESETVTIYQPNKPAVRLDGSATLTDDTVLAGFSLSLCKIFSM